MTTSEKEQTDPSGPAPGRRERLRREALADIKAAAREQIRTEGASGLSLRAVARAVGMSSPGLYRYYASRDDLFTDLIADAYGELTVALELARDTAGPALSERLRAVSMAYFIWTEQHRADWALIFGAPVPGYAAPPGGRTVQAAQRFGDVFLGLLGEAWGTPDCRFSSPPVEPAGGPGPHEDMSFLGAAVRLWSRLHGVIALGLFGHLPPVIDTAAVLRLYEAEVDDQLASLGLVEPAPRPALR